MGLKSFEFVVKGTVQGVNFRSWTVKQASQMGITGYVTNDSTGHVSGVAEGEGEALDKFAKVLQKGPSAADVADVVINKEEDISSKKYSSFDVEH
ncbi:Acylphosphatase [Cystobasidium minutum MCA 4210]|uniref:Acylphosphatase n=1 Tax=Cystobasidium minutum MCA 4210 TaxID=1397322 RepID=UPI0034CDDB3D|eukprot:jgi/Rhomi1/194411/gm1.2625_g